MNKYQSIIKTLKANNLFPIQVDGSIVRYFGFEVNGSLAPYLKSIPKQKWLEELRIIHKLGLTCRQTTNAMDLTQQLDQHTDRVVHILSKTVEELTRQSKEAMSTTQEDLLKAFDIQNKKSHISEFLETLKATLKVELGPESEAVKKIEGMLDLNNTKSPLASLNREVKEKITDLSGRMEKIDKTLAVQKETQKVISKTPLKGEINEEDVGATLTALAAIYMDEVEDVSKSYGSSNRKTGDWLIKVNSHITRRIALECKDTKLSNNKALEEIRNTRKNRNADFVILTFNDENQFPIQGQVFVLGPNYLMCLNEHVKIGYQISRSLVSRQVNDSAIDLVKIQTLVRNIIDETKTIESILKALASVMKNSSKTREDIGRLWERVSGYTEDIMNLTAEASA